MADEPKDAQSETGDETPGEAAPDAPTEEAPPAPTEEAPPAPTEEAPPAPTDETPSPGVTEQQEQKPAAPAATAAPGPTVVVRRLVRRPEGKVIGGVCSGLAAYWGLDPVLVRIGFVLAALFSGGVVLVVYIVMWLVMPMAPEGEPPPPTPSTDWTNATRWTAIGAILLGAFLLFRNVWDFRGGIFWGLLLIGVGIALWGREFAFGSPREPGSTGGAATPPTGATTPTEPGSSIVAPPPPPPPGRTVPASAAAPAPSPSRREPSILGRLVVGAAALAVGIAVLLDNLDVLDVKAKGVTAVLLAIVGVGLLVGTWWGRARWLIVPGVVLALVLGAVSFVPFDVRPTFGNVLWQPREPQEIRSSYENAFGNATLDLTHVSFGREPHRILIKVRFGNVDIVVPREVPVVVRGRVKFGNLEAFGRQQSGADVRDTVRSPGDRDVGRLTIVTDVAFGNTGICREVPHAETGCQGTESIPDIGGGRVDIRRGGVDVDLDVGDR